MKKRTMVLLVVLLLAVVGVGAVGVYRVQHAYSDYGRVMEANWGFALPEEAGIQEVFEADEGPSFHGDGIRYHVFSYEQEAPIQEMTKWQTEDPRVGSSYTAKAEKWLDEIQVPQEERPDYSACVFYEQRRQLETDEMLLCWNQEQGRLYVLESFF